MSPPPAASVLNHHPRWRREGGVQPGSSSLGHSWEVLTTSLRPQRSATRRVFLSPLALHPGSQQLDTNKLFWWLFLVPLCLLLAARHPRWSPGLTCGEDTACHCLLSARGGCWQQPETTLWLLRPRPHGGLGTLGLHMSFCLQRTVSWATGPVFECCFLS